MGKDIKTMDHLDKLEAQSVYIFREMFNKIDKVAMLWSFGKDSNVMIHLARKAFFGNIPFPLIHVDTELEFEEVYEFRDKYVKEWDVNFIGPVINASNSSLPSSRFIGSTLRIQQQRFTCVFQSFPFGSIFSTMVGSGRRRRKSVSPNSFSMRSTYAIVSLKCLPVSRKRIGVDGSTFATMLMSNAESAPNEEISAILPLNSSLIVALRSCSAS
jgi:hypothetical protein